MAKRRLVFANRAVEDLAAIRRWLTQAGSGQRAERRLQTIRDRIEGLRARPCLYGMVDHPNTRELPLTGGYRVLYRISPDTGHDETAGDIRVLRVYGPGQSREAG